MYIDLFLACNQNKCEQDHWNSTLKTHFNIKLTYSFIENYREKFVSNYLVKRMFIPKGKINW